MIDLTHRSKVQLKKKNPSHSKINSKNINLTMCKSELHFVTITTIRKANVKPLFPNEMH